MSWCSASGLFTIGLGRDGTEERKTVQAIEKRKFRVFTRGGRGIGLWPSFSENNRVHRHLKGAVGSSTLSKEAKKREGKKSLIVLKREQRKMKGKRPLFTGAGGGKGSGKASFRRRNVGGRGKKGHLERIKRKILLRASAKPEADPSVERKKAAEVTFVGKGGKNGTVFSSIMKTAARKEKARASRKSLAYVTGTPRARTYPREAGSAAEGAPTRSKQERFLPRLRKGESRIRRKSCLPRQQKGGQSPRKSPYAPKKRMASALKEMSKGERERHLCHLTKRRGHLYQKGEEEKHTYTPAKGKKRGPANRAKKKCPLGTSSRKDAGRTKKRIHLLRKGRNNNGENPCSCAARTVTGA